jgi:NADH-quinone oxidoreductase subunit A
MIPTAIVAYLALFATVGFLFVLACLLLGKVLRSHLPTPQKTETYECGEPAIGPGSVQFDLRFYVVALVFLIFEVEMAFFFPPATVFGQATRLLAGTASASPPAAATASEKPEGRQPAAAGEIAALSVRSARTLAVAAMVDLAIFFGVLLVGFAYVWSRGDLDWVRAVSHSASADETAVSLLQLRGEP